jgi:uncharacterized protein (TIGR03083 family)
MSDHGLMQESPVDAPPPADGLPPVDGTQPGARPPRYQPSTYVDRLDVTAQRFGQILADGDLAARVPPCPGWRVADLGAHLGGVHQWARHAVVAGNPDARISPAPAGQAALSRWYLGMAASLATTLRAARASDPAWHFGPKPRLASFWNRRQAHEAAMHLWDAASSQGFEAPIDDAFARDGIDETLSVFFPRQVRLGRAQPLKKALSLRTTGEEAPESWLIAGDGTSAAVGVDPDAAISGPAEALLLLLWGRIGVDDARLALAGDESAAHAVLTAGLTP